MRLGHLISFLLHAGLAAIIMIGAPDLMRRPEEVQFIPLELISDAEITDRTNVPDEPEEEPAAAEERAVEAPEEEPTPVLPDEPAEDPAPDTLAEEPAPDASEPEPEPSPDAEPTDNPIEPERVQDVAPRVKPKPERDDPLDFDALSSVIDRAKEDEEVRNPRTAPDSAPDAEAAGEGVGISGRLTATEKDLLRARLIDCWNVKAILGSPNAEKLKVILRVKFTEEGQIDGEPVVVNQIDIDLSGNPFWKNAAREAVAAVYKCEPYNFLSPERYEQWRELEFNFDPEEMLGL